MDSAKSRPITPRLIRLRDAPLYLGMDKNRFNREVRPYVALIRIGTQGIAFDRIDLDAWVDDHKSRNGCPAAKRSKPWDEASNDECQDAWQKTNAAAATLGTLLVGLVEESLARGYPQFVLARALGFWWTASSGREINPLRQHRTIQSRFLHHCHRAAARRSTITSGRGSPGAARAMARCAKLRRAVGCSSFSVWPRAAA